MPWSSWCASLLLTVCYYARVVTFPHSLPLLSQVYVAPLCVRLRDDPVLLSTSLLALSSVFRSYPSLGDVGFYFALLPTCKHLYPFLRQSFLVWCMVVASTVLGPIMYNLWIYSGAANANFYFAVTLAFNTAQVSNLLCNLSLSSHIPLLIN